MAQLSRKWLWPNSRSVPHLSEQALVDPGSKAGNNLRTRLPFQQSPAIIHLLVGTAVTGVFYNMDGFEGLSYTPVLTGSLSFLQADFHPGRFRPHAEAKGKRKGGAVEQL